ncbi:MAG TPA: sugar porter family MFS transporter [Rhodanobacteraceae bacterium]|nr:sugar porter family MFS transporter [Rhodanobacteraceae bacterium]
MATPGPDVLVALDARDPTAFDWSLTVLATLGGFLFGYDTANIGSVLDFLPFHLGTWALGYLVAGASIGAAVGALAAGPLTDRFGRKSLLVADAAIYAAGALLSAFTVSAAMLLVSRTLIGLAIGADSAIATAYIAEYAPAARRGALSMLQQWMITVGILVSYLVALGILKLVPGAAYGYDWRLILGLGALPALVALALRTRMPESPRWLLRAGRYDKLGETLRMLGIEATLAQIRQSAARLHAWEQRTLAQHASVWTPGVRRALLVVVVFFIFQQITGINVPLYYGPRLLSSLLPASSSPLEAAMGGIEMTSLVTAVNVAATYLGFRYIDRIGRRRLAMGGYAGMALFMLVAAIGLGLLAGPARIIVGTLGLGLFIASFAVGVGGTGWLLQGEVFPTAVRGRAAAIGATADWLANFAVIELFPVSAAGIGLEWVMVCFAALSVLAIVFIARWLPETKGLSVDEITDLFARKARG